MHSCAFTLTEACEAKEDVSETLKELKPTNSSKYTASIYDWLHPYMPPVFLKYIASVHSLFCLNETSACTWRLGGLVESKASSENILPGMVGEPWWAKLLVYQIDPMWYHAALLLPHTQTHQVFLGPKTISESIVDERNAAPARMFNTCE